MQGGDEGRGKGSETWLQGFQGEHQVAASGQVQKDCQDGWALTRQEQIWEGKGGGTREVPNLAGGCCKAFPEHSGEGDPSKETDPRREEDLVETVPQVEELVAKILEAESQKAWSPREVGRSPFSQLFSNSRHFSPKFLPLLRPS